MKKIRFGLSPCPNDTFMFYGLLKAGIGSHKYSFYPVISDIEDLNRHALEGRLDITKVSIHVCALVLKDYALLRSGAALGRGCGPLIVTRKEFVDRPLEELTIAVPGRHTTAALLLGLYNKKAFERAIEMPFHQIMPAIKKGKLQAGVIIHEGRFVYHLFGLQKIEDLGQWWEDRTGLPLPLGGIIGRRDLGHECLLEVEEMIRESILLARRWPSGLEGFIRAHAQEMDPSVIRKHIDTYVNEYSLELGPEGTKAIKRLFEEAALEGIIPETPKEVFLH
ncbi:MAG: 1,4-dihydroxy-6-naphthoate synthase [Nitrospirae bacterium]|nr:MAG: 1,4-dihydroxy-6-naphthoate synthase [Nitrospirota bacterium]